MKWIKFNPKAVNLPKEGRLVLVEVEESESQGMPASVCVGFLKKWSGGNKYFVTPGMRRRNRKITYWCDCLGDDFTAPTWAKTHKELYFKNESKNVERDNENKALQS